VGEYADDAIDRGIDEMVGDFWPDHDDAWSYGDVFGGAHPAAIREKQRTRKTEKENNMTTAAEPQEKSKTTVLTPTFRISYPNVFTPRAASEGQKPKYSISMIFDKKTDLTVMKNAVYFALVAKWSPDKTKWPKGLKLPFRDGSEKDQDGYGPDVIFVNASSDNKPGVVDQNVVDIIDPSKFYGGAYGRATVNAFAYDKAGNKGVAFGLNNVQLVADGEPFSSRSKPSEDFTSIAQPAGQAGGAAPKDPLADLGA
jgi:hypothetical protein